MLKFSFLQTSGASQDSEGEMDNCHMHRPVMLQTSEVARILKMEWTIVMCTGLQFSKTVVPHKISRTEWIIVTTSTTELSNSNQDDHRKQVITYQETAVFWGAA